MKQSLKSIILIVTLFIGMISISGCKNESQSNGEGNNNPNSSNIESMMDPDTLSATKQNKIIWDSIANFDNRLKKLHLVISQQKASIEKNHSTIESLKRNSFLSILLAWIIAAVSIFTAVFALIKAKRALKLANKYHHNIEEFNDSLSRSENRVTDALRNNNTTLSRMSNLEYNMLSSRITKIEQQLNCPQKQVEPQQPPKSSDFPRSPHPKKQTGYFGLPKKMSETEAYFRDLIGSRDSEARFEVIVTGETAEFRPLDGQRYLNDMQSNDTIKMALDIQGCPLSEASRMTVITPGNAKLTGGRWVITRNASIKLYK